ncbi:hypothetical protein CBOM_08084 [Ceraceosorus bombacis]|uniref:Uncharacterized protein n=1 Tax=Ceraceosorus bombacis TaxID=401625 RepID=A0A0P1BRK3_9BASI|nr:hypothetical protein CBOM_08084 [Ceraceosorus bombacis]
MLGTKRRNQRMSMQLLGVGAGSAMGAICERAHRPLLMPDAQVTTRTPSGYCARQQLAYSLDDVDAV